MRLWDNFLPAWSQSDPPGGFSGQGALSCTWRGKRAQNTWSKLLEPLCWNRHGSSWTWT